MGVVRLRAYLMHAVCACVCVRVRVACVVRVRGALAGWVACVYDARCVRIAPSTCAQHTHTHTHTHVPEKEGGRSSQTRHVSR